jgi:hypothetical protein
MGLSKFTGAVRRRGEQRRVMRMVAVATGKEERRWGRDREMVVVELTAAIGNGTD